MDEFKSHFEKSQKSVKIENHKRALEVIPFIPVWYKSHDWITWTVPDRNKPPGTLMEAFQYSSEFSLGTINGHFNSIVSPILNMCLPDEMTPFKVDRCLL